MPPALSVELLHNLGDQIGYLRDYQTGNAAITVDA